MKAGISGRAGLRLVQSAQEAPAESAWFCGHCAAAPLGAQPPAPSARVCTACGLGLLLESIKEIAPDPGDAFLVVDATLMVQAISDHGEQLLAVEEDMAVSRPVANLLVPADAEARSPGFAGAVVDAVNGGGPVHAYVRPWNTYGVRLRARIAACGPPRAALVVLETARPRLRAV